MNKDDRIKSALEIAMEKVASMAELTPEELNEQTEKEYRPRGEAIASKYLGNTLRGKDLRSELKKYKGKEGEIVRRAFLSALCQSLGLVDMRESLKAIDGIQMVETNVNLEEIRREIESVAQEFRQQMEQRYAVYENLEREKLGELWISGSAVRPNLDGSADWQRELTGIQSAYETRLNKVRENLVHLIGI